MPPKKSRKSVNARADDVAEAGMSKSVATTPSLSAQVGLRNRDCMYRERLKPTDPPPPPPPPGITVETSPMRHSASNRREGEPQTRAFIDAALKKELWDARYLSDDLNDLMFRSYISTELARDVLEGLLGADMLTVHKVVNGRKQDVRKGTRDAAIAIKNAYERALVHGCKRDGLEQAKSPSKSRDCDDVAWNWSWKGFPKAPLKERALVDYLNTIVDTALGLSCMKNRKPLYRFAVPHDTHHAYPLSHEPDKADSRPDFVVLPIDAFEKHEETGSLTIYEPKKEWQNFTMVRLTGECKNSDDTAGVHQVQRYMRDTRRAQPWLRFVTAMAVTREVVNFVRGDGSGMERVRMRLQFGRSCLEFVRMLMAVALCEAEVFGKNSHIGLATQALTTRVVVGTSQAETSTSGAAASEQGQSSDAALTTSAQGSIHQSLSSARSSAQSSTTHLVPPPDTHASRSSQRSGAITASSGRVTRSSEKRRRNNEDDANLMPPPPAKKEVHEEVRLMVQVPTTLFGTFEYEGLLFTGASIRGRGTVVFVVHRKSTPSVKVALKLAWQDVARKPERDEVLEILSKNPHHENVLVPKRVQVVEDSTLRTIRAFTQSEVDADDMMIEDRILEVHETELRRPVRYFWSVNDFVLGLRGAVLGHLYLLKIHILHRDVSENNVVLACIPGQPRGCLMDFDMAVRYEARERPTSNAKLAFQKRPNNSASQESHKGPFKAERTGTIPYMSVNVLDGQEHTHYDDIESFFYILVLFFVSYRGPLLMSDLDAAGKCGFRQVLGSGRAQNVCDWPAIFKPWSESMSAAADAKAALRSEDHSLKFTNSIAEDVIELWGPELSPAIGDLIVDCLLLFQAAPHRVSHEQFIEVLDKWLKAHPAPPDGCNNCPFTDSEGRPYV